MLVAGAVSKTYAMTGWRIGYGLAPAPIVAAMLKLQSHSTSNPNSFAQKAAIEALRGPQESVRQMLAEYRHRRDFLIPRLRAIPGVECSIPRGAFYAYPNVGGALDRGGIKTPLNSPNGCSRKRTWRWCPARLSAPTTMCASPRHLPARARTADSTASRIRGETGVASPPMKNAHAAGRHTS